MPLTGELLATFESSIAATLAKLGVPGAAVGVVQGGEVTFLQGFGVRELGRPEPVTPDTLLRIGSVTKSFSSLLAATLVDTGQVTWDTLLVDLLPDFAVADPDLTSRLTVADAFCACSGLPRRDFEFIFPANDLTPESMIASMASLPLTAPFGEKYQYNNQLVAAGGFAAGVADGGAPYALGHSYAIALRDRVLNPVGMPRTTYDLTEVVAGNDYASPHAADLFGELRPVPLLMDDTWLVPVAPFSLINLAAGAMRVPALDYTLGTLLGLAPGVGLMSVLGHNLTELLRAPTVGSIATIGAVVAGVIALSVAAQIVVARKRGARQAGRQNHP